MNVLKTKVWPVVAGLLTAFVVMMIFEYTNSFFYPLPTDLVMSDTNAVHAFTASLPWTAFVLVFLGWVLGAFKAGCVTTYLAKEHTFKLSLVTGLILTVLGILNNLAIGHSMLFNIVSLPMFLVFTYLGHAYLRKVHSARVTEAA